MAINSNMLDKAIVFATKAHASVERKGKGFPYIVHPMEAVSIVATMTSDQDLLAAAALHDVVEDTEYTLDDIEREFGSHVARLVKAESDVEVPGESWHDCKQKAIDRIRNADTESKIVALGDKLSNMRAIASDYEVIGDKLWDRFHTSDVKEHEWHYRGLADSLSELSYTKAYQEFIELIGKVFG